MESLVYKRRFLLQDDVKFFVLLNQHDLNLKLRVRGKNKKIILKFLNYEKIRKTYFIIVNEESGQ